MAGRPKGIPKTGGRVKGVPNKLTADVRALAQEYGPSAIQTLAEIMQDREQVAPARVAAAKELMDRGYGKAVQQTEISGKDGAPLAYEFRVQRAGLDIVGT